MSEPPIDLLGIGAINADFIKEIGSKPSSPFEHEKILTEDEAKEALQKVGDEWTVGGSAFNTVRYVAKLGLGLNTGFVGVAGTSKSYGQGIAIEIDNLRTKYNLSTEYIKFQKTRRPGVCIADVYAGAHRWLETCPFANDEMAALLDEIRTSKLEQLANARLLHVTSLLDQESANSLVALVEELAKLKQGPLLSFDPGYAWLKERLLIAKRILPHTDILFVNRDELGVAAGKEKAEPSPELAKTVLDMMGPSAKVVVLKSAEHVTCYKYVGGSVKGFEYPNPLLTEDDLNNPVGAGDAMAAGYLAALLTEASEAAPVRLGQAVAATKLRYKKDGEFQARIGEVYRKSVERFELHGIADRAAQPQVFIGHGGSTAWLELKDILQDEFGLQHDEFDRISTVGGTIQGRLFDMLDASAFAFLVLTAEDETKDGEMQARMNVIHETGLWQGRLGPEKAIILLEEGCKSFSNIDGRLQVRFKRGQMKACFLKIRDVLKREGILSSHT